MWKERMGTRVFIGRLSHSARDRDVERFFKGYGKIMEIVLKTGFGFVEFEDPRDADDAVCDLNGRTLCGERVTIEHARSPNERYQARTSFGSSSRRPSSYLDRVSVEKEKKQKQYGSDSPKRTDYRILVENLSSRCGRQELREFLNKVGEVTYADVTRDRNEGVAEFATLGDMKNVMTKLNGAELRGRKIRLVEDRGRNRSKSPSRKRSGHSKSRSRSRSVRRSRSGRRSRSRSVRRSPRRSAHRSPRRSRTRSPRRSRSARHSRSVHRSSSVHRSRSPRRSPSPRVVRESRSLSKGGKSASRSPSHHRSPSRQSGSRSRSRSPAHSSPHEGHVNNGNNEKDESHSD